MGVTQPRFRRFQELVFNKQIKPSNTGEDTDYISTSSPEKQQAMDDQSKATE